MSRLGKIPVKLPEKVTFSVKDGKMSAEGSKGKLSRPVPPMVEIKVEAGSVIVSADSSRRGKMLHGLTRSLIQGMVTGVSSGFRKDLEIVGVGYKAQLSGAILTVMVGLSHPVAYKIPDGIKVSVTDNTKIAIEGIDKQLVGEAAATIRKFRKPEPYKGKGIRYVGEHIVMKEGKTVA